MQSKNVIDNIVLQQNKEALDILRARLVNLFNYKMQLETADKQSRALGDKILLDSDISRVTRDIYNTLILAYQGICLRDKILASRRQTKIVRQERVQLTAEQKRYDTAIEFLNEDAQLPDFRKNTEMFQHWMNSNSR